MMRWSGGGRALPLLVLAASLALASCASATIEDAVPKTLDEASSDAGEAEQFPPPDVLAAETLPDSRAPVEDEAAGAAEAEPRLPDRTGEYPNLNARPAAATAQRTPAQTRARLSELRSLRQRQAEETSSDPVVVRRDELRELGLRHAEDALRQIEDR